MCGSALVNALMDGNCVLQSCTEFSCGWDSQILYLSTQGMKGIKSRDV